MTSRFWLYKEDVPPTEYDMWQPKRVMQLLLEVDPYADQSITLHMGKEKEYGKPAEQMKMIGTEHVLSACTLKKHYDALGAYLHTPTLKQLQNKENNQSLNNLRERCNQLVSEIEKVLSSTMFNVHLGSSTTIDCMRCKSKVRRRLPLSKRKEIIEAKCFECQAAYHVTEEEQGVKWVPLLDYIPCLTPNCAEKKILWKDELKPGTEWACIKCQQAYVLTLNFKKQDAISKHASA